MVTWLAKLRGFSRPVNSSTLVNQIFCRMDQEMQLKEEVTFDTIQLLRVNRRIFMARGHRRDRARSSVAGDWRGDHAARSGQTLIKDW